MRKTSLYRHFDADGRLLYIGRRGGVRSMTPDGACKLTGGQMIVKLTFVNRTAALALHERREPAHASDCECTECWQAMEVNCK